MLDDNDFTGLLQPPTPPHIWESYVATGDADYAYELPNVARFRVNLFKQQRKALQKSELVILMRPQVVSDEVWLDELRKSAEAFKELR